MIDNYFYMLGNTLKILSILFQLLAIESVVHFQFFFLKLFWTWKSFPLKNQIR